MILEFADAEMFARYPLQYGESKYIVVSVGYEHAVKAAATVTYVPGTGPLKVWYANWLVIASREGCDHVPFVKSIDTVAMTGPAFFSMMQPPRTV